MTGELQARREAIKRKIKNNMTAITISRLSLVDDGMGGMIEGPFGTPVTAPMRVRISHESSAGSVPKKGQVPAGFSTNLSRFILTDYLSEIFEGETFSAIGKEWVIGSVDPLYASGGIVGYQAPLQEAESGNS